MFKRKMLIGIMVFGLMTLFQTQGIGGSWGLKPGAFGFGVYGSFGVSTTWVVKNTRVESVSWSVQACPTSASVFYIGPSAKPSQDGGLDSYNFASNLTDIVGVNIIDFALEGKKSVDSMYIWGSCDDCTDDQGNYNGNGELWYLLYDAAEDAGYLVDSGGEPCVDALCEIYGIKEYASSLEPNMKFTPYDIQINSFNAVLWARQDFDRDGIEEPAAYAEFTNCSGDSDEIKFPVGTEYVCLQTYVLIPGDSSFPPTQPITTGVDSFCGWEKDSNTGDWIPFFNYH